MLIPKQGGTMPILRSFAVTGTALIALISGDNAYFGRVAGGSHVNRAPLNAWITWPRGEASQLPPERWYAKDVTPALRIKLEFAQFAPGQSEKLLNTRFL
jgi:hypothetical protein